MLNLFEKLNYIYYWLLYVNEFGKLEIAPKVIIKNKNYIELYDTTLYSDDISEIIKELINCEKLWDNICEQELDLIYDLISFDNM